MTTAVDFITSVYADAAYYDKPTPITEEEAAYTMAAWKEEGIEYPPTVTPLLFSRTWNILCEKHITNK